MDAERFDFSALDPESDEVRWRALVNGVVERAAAVIEARADRDDPTTLIASWRRPILLAAAAAVALLVPVEFLLERREFDLQRAHALATRTVAWATATAGPTAADILRGMSPEATR